MDKHHRRFPIKGEPNPTEIRQKCEELRKKWDEDRLAKNERRKSVEVPRFPDSRLDQ